MTRLTDALERARKGDDGSPNGPIRPTIAAVDAPPSGESGLAWQDEELTSAAAADVNSASPAQKKEPLPETANRFVVAEGDEALEDEVPPAAFDYHFARASGVKLVVGEKPDHTLVEQYRHLAAALHHAQLKHHVRTVMITSAIEAEGKTTTAANVALTLSHSHQRKVLLIDADLRRPSLHTVFQVANRDGLSEYLRDFGQARRRPSIHVISPNLSLFTAGRPTQDPMGALVSQDMKDIIDEAAEHFDWVIVDTPPVALLSDANLLAGMIDSAILVVRANSTDYPLVQRAQKSIGPERILGVVLNRARRADLALGYGYYYYGYSYAPKTQPEKTGMLSRLFRRG